MLCCNATNLEAELKPIEKVTFETQDLVYQEHSNNIYGSFA